MYMLLVDAFDKFNNIIVKVAPDNAGKYSSVQSFVVLVANALIVFAIGLSVVSLSFGFIQMATSSGDEKRTERAQRALLWGAAGILISLLATALKVVLLKAMDVRGVL